MWCDMAFSGPNLSMGSIWFGAIAGAALLCCIVFWSVVSFSGILLIPHILFDLYVVFLFMGASYVHEPIVSPWFFSLSVHGFFFFPFNFHFDTIDNDIRLIWICHRLWCFITCTVFKSVWFVTSSKRFEHSEIRLAVWFSSLLESMESRIHHSLPLLFPGAIYILFPQEIHHSQFIPSIYIS